MLNPQHAVQSCKKLLHSQKPLYPYLNPATQGTHVSSPCSSRSCTSISNCSLVTTCGYLQCVVRLQPALVPNLLAKLDVPIFCTPFLLIIPLLLWLNNRSWQSEETCPAAPLLWWAGKKLAANSPKPLGQSHKNGFFNLFVQCETPWERKGKSCKTITKGNCQGFGFHSLPLLMYRRDLKRQSHGCIDLGFLLCLPELEH